MLVTFSCAGAQNSSDYAAGSTGFMLMSNYTTSAITVASASTLCYTGTPGYPVVEATISSVHQVGSFPSGLLTRADLLARPVGQLQMGMTNLRKWPSLCKSGSTPTCAEQIFSHAPLTCVARCQEAEGDLVSNPSKRGGGIRWQISPCEQALTCSMHLEVSS